MTLDARPAPVVGNPVREESASTTYTFNQVGNYTYRGDNPSVAGLIVVFKPPTPVH